MPNYNVTVYNGGFKQEIKVQARNQNDMNRQIRGAGWERSGHIRNTQRWYFRPGYDIKLATIHLIN